MAPKVTDKERARIVAFLRDGQTQGWTAKEVGRDKSTVSRVAKAEGIDSNVAATKKATDARRDYTLAERLLLLNEGFDKARDLLPTIKEPKDLQAWMIALATGIDKRRLEDGQATDRTESVDPERRKRLHGTLDELDALRRSRSGNPG